jgi:hypothetical protein
VDRFNRGRRQRVAPPLETLPLSVRYFGVQDWQAAAALPDLDIFGCDPYWYTFQAEPEPFVRVFTEKALRAARHARDLTGRRLDTQIWVQTFDVPAGRESELYNGVLAAARLGATHVAAWAYGGNASMSALRPDRPDVCWQVIGDAFRQVARR